MARATFNYITLAAISCLALGAVLAVAAMVAGPMVALFWKYALQIGATAFVLCGVGTLAWTGVQLWLTMRGERVAYRVLYHCEQPPDGTAIGRTLEALARSVGYVSVVWRIRPATADANTYPNASPLSLFIVAPLAARSALEGVLPGLLPGTWAERCKEPRPMCSSPGQVVRAWRWDGVRAGDGGLSDPLACGAHLSELAEGIALGERREPRAPRFGVREIQVRLTLRPQGISAIVTALYEPVDQLPVSESEPYWHETLDTARVACAPPTPAPGTSPVAFLRPILFGWPFPLRLDLFRARVSHDATSRSAGCKVVQARGALVAGLAARYPLWERPYPGPRGREGVRRTAAERGTRVACLCFPSTTEGYSSLDSVVAREVAAPQSYELPLVPAQVLVFGETTGDGRPIGVPALRLPHTADTESDAVANADTTRGSGAANPGPETRADGVAPVRVLLDGAKATIHPMLAEHLLVAGGTETWRRDVAGSIVSQALEMGMCVVSVDGGPPPDEPSAADHWRARLVSAEPHDAHSRSRASSSDSRGTSPRLSKADPLSALTLRLGDPSSAKRIAQIDLDNPAGSVRPNMLYVSAPPWLEPLQGESLALSMALRTGLPAQMDFLRAMNVRGMADAGVQNAYAEAARLGEWGQGARSAQEAREARGTLAAPGVPEYRPGAAIVEAWLAVLLLRHHRVRLLLAARGMPSAVRDAEHVRFAPSWSHRTPPCPDLHWLMLVLEQSEALIALLKRERKEWSDPAWLQLLRERGGMYGEQAVLTAQQALEHAVLVESMSQSELYLFGADLRSQLSPLVGHPALSRMLRGPHISMADLLHNGPVRMLRVNLSGAYRTRGTSHSDENLARKRYGLYLLYTLRAMSRQRVVLNEHYRHVHPISNAPNMHNAPDVIQMQPNPLLLMLHGAGAWLGAGSPPSERAILGVLGDLGELGGEWAGVAVAATVSGLRDLPAYWREASGGGAACRTFGSLILGPAPMAQPDAPPALLGLAEAEMRCLREGLQELASVPAQEAERLVGVLRHIDEGSALVVTRVPGRGKVVCTAHVGSTVAADVRASWASC